MALWTALDDRPWLPLVFGMALLIMLVHGLVFALWELIVACLEIARGLRAGRARGWSRGRVLADLVWRGLRLPVLAVLVGHLDKRIPLALMPAGLAPTASVKTPEGDGMLARLLLGLAAAQLVLVTGLWAWRRQGSWTLLTRPAD